MSFFPEHPKGNQDLKFTPPGKTTSPFICEPPPPTPPSVRGHNRNLKCTLFNFFLNACLPFNIGCIAEIWLLQLTPDNSFGKPPSINNTPFSVTPRLFCILIRGGKLNYTYKTLEFWKIVIWPWNLSSLYDDSYGSLICLHFFPFWV